MIRHDKIISMLTQINLIANANPFFQPSFMGRNKRGANKRKNAQKRTDKWRMYLRGRIAEWKWIYLAIPGTSSLSRQITFGKAKHLFCQGKRLPETEDGKSDENLHRFVRERKICHKNVALLPHRNSIPFQHFIEIKTIKIFTAVRIDDRCTPKCANNDSVES